MTNPKFPVKWTAPEAYSDASEFTIKSDVWSFGVLLWQVCMSGKFPFKNMSNNEVSFIIYDPIRFMIYESYNSLLVPKF